MKIKPSEICLLLAVLCSSAYAHTDAEYLEKFEKEFPKLAQPAKFEEYATPAKFDELYLGKMHTSGGVQHNDNGGLAWGMSYNMMALNLMYQATNDTKYLDDTLNCIRVVMNARDTVRGKTLWTGRTVPAWGCDKYAESGRAVFAVHTGIICFPILDFLSFAKENAAYRDKMGKEYDEIQTAMMDALAVHDRQWTDGPGKDEGYYVGMDQEKACNGKPLPGNRLSAMGMALWNSWKLTGNTTHRDRAVAVGHYMRNRVYTTPDDSAFFWSYWLPVEAVGERKQREEVNGEDSSHGSLSMWLLLKLGREGQVLTSDDMKRLAHTFTQGLGRLGGNVLFGDVTGSPESSPKNVALAARWMPLMEYDKAVAPTITQFFLDRVATPSPLDLATLIFYRAKGLAQ